MQHVLILTKNPLAEETIVSKMQRLNCEVLCSTDLLHRLQQRMATPLLSYFQWVILSESLCHSEVEQILEQLKNYSLLTLRVVENYPSEEEQVYWQELGISEWLYKNTCYESLREKINELSMKMEQPLAVGSQVLTFPNQGKETTKNSLKLLVKSLSKTELKVFECLLNAYPTSGVLSRKELCDHLWRDGDTASNMSQLSCLINKLKRKFELHGISGETITTLWGRGYQLSSGFYEYWVQNHQQLEEIKYAMN